MKQYLDLVKQVRDHGRTKMDRTGTGTRSIFGAQMRFDLGLGFPIPTLKSTQLYRIANELLWFLSGSTDENKLANADRIHREATHLAASAAHDETIDGFITTLFTWDLNVRGSDAVDGWVQGNRRDEIIDKACDGALPDTPLSVQAVERIITYMTYHVLGYNFQHEVITKPSIWDEWAISVVEAQSPITNGDIRAVEDREVQIIFGELSRQDISRKEAFYCWVLPTVSAEQQQELWNRYLGFDPMRMEPFAFASSAFHFLNMRGVYEWSHTRTEYTRAPRTIGPMYGRQWRKYDGKVDQIKVAIETLRKDPMSRRICITAWDPTSLPDTNMSPKENAYRGNMALAPCHAFFQFFAEPVVLADVLNHYNWSHVAGALDVPNADEVLAEMQADGRLPKYRLSCQVYCRSQDLFLGTPYNVAEYALLTEMMAEEVGMMSGDLVWTGGDVHLYSNHMDQVETMVAREPRELPKLRIHNRSVGLFDHMASDFVLEGYAPHPAISAPVSI